MLTVADFVMKQAWLDRVKHVVVCAVVPRRDDIAHISHEAVRPPMEIV